MKKGITRMRDVFVPDLMVIPEWKQCYYDCQTLSKIGSFLIKCQKEYRRVFWNMKYYGKQNQTGDEYEALTRTLINIRLQIFRWGILFIKLSDIQNQIFFTFALMKCSEIKQKLKTYKKLLLFLKYEEPGMLVLLQNLFIQNHYIKQAVYFNIVKEEEILYYSQNQLNKYGQFRTQVKISKRLDRLLGQLDQQYNQIEDCYKKVARRNYYKDGEKKNDRYKQQTNIKYMGGSNSISIGTRSIFMISFIVGICLCIIAAVVIIFDIKNINIESNDTLLARNLVMWRGGSYIVIYLTILGFDVHIYEDSQINYRLIFSLENLHLPHAKFIWRAASLFALQLFVLFMIEIFIYADQTSRDAKSYFAPGLLIGTIIILILPFQFATGRFYFWKLLLEILKSVFCTNYKITFLVIWTAEQFVSLSQPFGDIFYTFCYIVTEPTYCEEKAPLASTGFIIVIFLIRIVQNSKAWHQFTQSSKTKKYNLSAPQFLGLLRAILSLLTTLFSLFQRFQLFEAALGIWITLSIITTLYSHFVDMRCDWGVIRPKLFLKNQVLFTKKKYMYYVLLFSNLLLRTAWVLTISQFKGIEESEVSKFLFYMGINVLEMFRRGLWNILRVEYEHIKNCEVLKATINDDSILDEMKEKAKQIYVERTKKSQSQNKNKKNDLMDQNTGNITMEHIMISINSSDTTNDDSFNQVINPDLQLSETRRRNQMHLLETLIARRKYEKKQIKQSSESNENILQDTMKIVRKHLKSEEIIDQFQFEEENHGKYQGVGGSDEDD